MDMSKLPFDIITEDEKQMELPRYPAICPYCHTKTIELYDSKNKHHKYEYLLRVYKGKETMMYERFERVTLTHFRCKICKKKFTIDWTRGYPKPLLVQTKFD